MSKPVPDGATFALVARVTDPSRVGGVTGLVGAAGGLGGFVPPLLMGYVYGRTDSYAIGLGLPFIIIGVGVGRLLGALRWITRHYHVISIVSGATLVITGVLFLSNRFFYLNVMSQRLFDNVVQPLLFLRL